MDKHIDKATLHFQNVLQDQLARLNRMKTREEQTDYGACLLYTSPSPRD